MLVILLVVIGAIVGFLAGLIKKARVSDLIGYLVVGVSGSSIAGMLFGSLGESVRSQTGALAAAATGAVCLVLFVEIIKKY